MHFDTPAQLRQQLITALGSELGSYTTGSGQVLPAIITVVDPNSKPVPEWVVNGLQCLIYYPLAKGVPVFGGACIREDWQVRLIQHDRMKTCHQAYRRILTAHPDCQVQSQLGQTSAIFEQWNLIIPQSHKIN
jgi:hypothetical protein